MQKSLRIELDFYNMVELFYFYSIRIHYPDNLKETNQGLMKQMLNGSMI